MIDIFEYNVLSIRLYTMYIRFMYYPNFAVSNSFFHTSFTQLKSAFFTIYHHSYDNRLQHYLPLHRNQVYA